MNLSASEQMVLSALREQLRAGLEMSPKRIAESVGLSESWVIDNLDKLRCRGLAPRFGHRRRPLLGTVIPVVNRERLLEMGLPVCAMPPMPEAE